jgi:ABC-type phosphate/phosphonate transport system ATPase subunit
MIKIKKSKLNSWCVMHTFKLIENSQVYNNVIVMQNKSLSTLHFYLINNIKVSYYRIRVVELLKIVINFK